MDKREFLLELQTFRGKVAAYRQAVWNAIDADEAAHARWEETPPEDGEDSYPEPETPSYEDELAFAQNLDDACDDMEKVLR